MNAPLSQYDPDRLHQRLVDLGDAWADADAAASLLEETRSSLMAKLFLQADGKSVAEREMKAKANQDMDSHIERMIEARRVATQARVAYDAAKVWVELARSLESSRRAEMTLR